jgi:hypothetical protein
MVRVIVAGLVGGIVTFLWGAVSHMLTPLGEMGFSDLPDEPAVMQALARSVPEKGLYGFPGAGMTQEEIAMLPPGPTGLLVFNPSGKWEMGPRQLGFEYGSNALAALVAAIVASRLAGFYGVRVILIAFIGVVGWLSISASQWTWYGFPDKFILAEGADQLIGWFLTGLAIAGIVPGPRYALAGG